MNEKEINNMKSGVVCPDCNSDDIQEVINESTVVTSGSKDFKDFLIWGPFFRKDRVETVKHSIYVCRSCGREF